MTCGEACSAVPHTIYHTLLHNHNVCISYNTGKSALPDIYARARGRAAPEGECVYIRQSTSACVIYYLLYKAEKPSVRPSAFFPRQAVNSAVSASIDFRLA